MTVRMHSTGLFHRAIIQSGGALIYSARGSRNGKQLAEALGNKNTDEKELLEILEKLPLNKLLEVQDSFHDVSMFDPRVTVNFSGLPTQHFPSIFCFPSPWQN